MRPPLRARGRRVLAGEHAQRAATASRRPYRATEDVTATPRAELGQHLSSRRAVLSRTPGGPELQQIADLVVPTLADWCGIDLPGPARQDRNAAAAHADPARVEPPTAARAQAPGGRRRRDPHVLRHRRAGPVGEPPELLEPTPRHAEHLDAARGSGWPRCSPSRSVPATCLGVLVLFRLPRRLETRFDDAADPLPAPADRRCSQRADARPRRGTLGALRPRTWTGAGPAGMRVAAASRPAGDGEAGGRFYEVIGTPGRDRRDGDVVGKGGRRGTRAPRASRSAPPPASPPSRRRARRAQQRASPAGGLSLTTVVAVSMRCGTCSVSWRATPAPRCSARRTSHCVGRYGPMLGAVEVPTGPPRRWAAPGGHARALHGRARRDLPGGERFGEARLRGSSRRRADRRRARRGARGRLLGLRLRDDVAVLVISCPGRRRCWPAARSASAPSPSSRGLPPRRARRAAAGAARLSALAGHVAAGASADTLIVVSELRHQRRAPRWSAHGCRRGCCCTRLTAAAVWSRS